MWGLPRLLLSIMNTSLLAQSNYTLHPMGSCEAIEIRPRLLDVLYRFTYLLFSVYSF